MVYHFPRSKPTKRRNREVVAKESDHRSRVLVADAQPVPRQGIIQLINRSHNTTVCGEADEKESVLEAIVALKPDVLIIDVILKDTGGIELVRVIKARHPRLPILVYSHHDEAIFVPRALRAGASGYIMKQERPELVLEAIQTVLAGEIYLSGKMARRMLSRVVNGDAATPIPLLNTLSDRQIQVFELVGHCLGSREIADRLNVSIKTVNTHRAQIKQKLSLRNSTELIQWATQWVQSGLEAEIGGGSMRHDGIAT